MEHSGGARMKAGLRAGYAAEVWLCAVGTGRPRRLGVSFDFCGADESPFEEKNSNGADNSAGEAGQRCRE